MIKFIRFLKWYFKGHCYHCGSSNTIFVDNTINAGMPTENQMMNYTICKDCDKVTS